MAEVIDVKNDCLNIKAIAQGSQGDWTTWEGVVGKTISVADLWKIS